jgi:CheY-like chemotaxis protein
VLLVDDDTLVRETHQDLLGQWACVVIAAQDAETALQRAARDAPIDAVVTDYRLPGMSGVALVEALRVERPWLPAIIVSGDMSEGWRSLATSDVLTAWLVKPARPERLRSLLLAANCRRVNWRACLALAG